VKPAPIHQVQVRRSPLAGVHAEFLCSARSFGRHWHDSYGFGVMDAGGHRSASGRGPVEALPGHIVTSNPAEVHDGIPLASMSRRWRMVHVSPAAMDRLVDMDKREYTRPVFEDAAVRGSINRLFACWDDLDVHATALAVGGFEEALTLACGLLAWRHSSRRGEVDAPAPLHRVRECLLDQLDDPPTLGQLAALAGLSRFQLVRQFTHWQGLPPFAWLTQQRLCAARRMIAAGTPLAAAAAACGFADQSHLHRQFARSFGCTPGQWQRAMASALQ
jgi:AraC-like DNA-binding protein